MVCPGVVVGIGVCVGAVDLFGSIQRDAFGACPMYGVVGCVYASKERAAHSVKGDALVAHGAHALGN